MPEEPYEVALSFAGEDREYVEGVKNLLNEAGVKVFYDNDEEAYLWGKNLLDTLTEIYQNAKARAVSGRGRGGATNRDNL